MQGPIKRVLDEKNDHLIKFTYGNLAFLQEVVTEQIFPQEVNDFLIKFPSTETSQRAKNRKIDQNYASEIHLTATNKQNHTESPIKISNIHQIFIKIPPNFDLKPTRK